MMTERAPQVPDFEAGYDTYLSPFTFRYGSDEMREIWSQENYWSSAREVWLAVAQAQLQAGLVTPEQVQDLEANIGRISVEEIFALEKKKGHDVAAAIAEFSSVAPIGGEILHQGLTSEDVLSNVEVMQMHESFGLIRGKLVSTLAAFAPRIDQYKDLVCMGFTHLQAAEPTTMGYRFAKYAQDLLFDLQFLDSVVPMIKGKGVKGAVGTSASFAHMLDGTGLSVEQHEQLIMNALGLEAVTVSDQTYPRKFLYFAESVLGSIGQSLHRFGLDMQLLQSSAIDEVSEPRRKGQIGSSAMPHKQNPIHAENIDALTEVQPGALFSSWMTGAYVTLERTLRDSAGKRSWLPESFLIIDESLMRAERIAKGLVVHESSVKANLERYAPFCTTEILMAHLVAAGMDRKDAHELLVSHAEAAVEAKRSGQPNPFKDLIISDERVTGLIGISTVNEAFDEVYHHVGTAAQQCEKFLQNELLPAITSPL